METLRQVVRLRPGYPQSQMVIAAALGHLGQLDEARELSRAQPRDPRYLQPP